MGTYAQHLCLKQVVKAFGGIVAVDQISLELGPGEVTILVGPNGAGKTTLFDIITGYLHPDRGRVLLDDSDITGLPPHVIASLGVGRLFQEPRPFRNLSVLENLVVAAPAQLGEGITMGLIKRKSVRRAQMIYRERAQSLLARTGLARYENSVAGSLSYGQQKILALLRLIMAESTVLLLDEPTSGIFRDTVYRIVDILSELAQQGRSILIVEHDLEPFLAIAGTVVLIVGGKAVTVQPDGPFSGNAIIRDFITHA